MRHVISFYGSVSASSINTLVSKHLRFPYIIDSIRVKFALGHVGTVQHRFFVSNDDVVVTSGNPTGFNVLGQHGQVDYVVGDDDVIVVEDNTNVTQQGTWLKVHVTNSDTAVHTVNCIITINDMRIHPEHERLVESLKKGAVRVMPDESDIERLLQLLLDRLGTGRPVT